MEGKLGIEKCRSFIDCHLQAVGQSSLVRGKEAARPAITISRQIGSGGRSIAALLAEYLQTHGPETTCPWTVFDKNLVEKVLEDHHLPSRMAQFMSEDKVSQVEDMMQELLGLHPPSWTLVRQMSETILHLAELGYVILIGRGANVITAGLKSAFHVRLVGSLEKRVQRLEKARNMDPKAALEFIRQEDRGRKRYLMSHFQKDLDDPLLYHLVINTDLIPAEEAARLIGGTVIRRFFPEGRL